MNNTTSSSNKKQLNRPLILASVILGMFLSAIEATIVATSMPNIVADLGNFTLYSWVFSAYLLTSSSMMLIFGKLSDVVGRRPIYIIGITIFLIGSTMAGFSNSMPFLIISRFIQGIGAGALMPIAMTIVGDIYTKEERAKIQGYLSSVWGISAILGPLVGALFVEFLNWRYVFWMNIPLGILSAIGIIFLLKENIEKKKVEINIKNMALIVVGISLMMYILVEGGVSITWLSGQMLGLIMITAIIFGLFFLFERKSHMPVFPPELIVHRTIVVAFVASLLTGMVMIAIQSYLPTFVQGVMGKSALVAGFTLTTMSIGWPLASTISGRLLLVIGYRRTAIIGGCFLIGGTVMFVFFPIIQHVAWAAVSSFFVGVGMGMTSTTFIVAIQSTVGWKIRGIATATNSFMLSLGSALGVALLSGVLNQQIKQKINEANMADTISVDSVGTLLNESESASLSSANIEVLQSGLLSGLQFVFIGICILAVLAFIAINLMPREREE